MQYQKVKSVAKTVMGRGTRLEDTILSTMKTCSDLVGSTLGPGGMSVVIERQELNMAPLVTKDGVTVFRALGFTDPTAQVIMEAARDASVRTAAEAGDGTTSATILAEAFVRRTIEFCKQHPRISPQRVMRILNESFTKTIGPFIEGSKELANTNAKRLEDVARVSANGDKPLAKAVLECFERVGDAGNVTITEESGPSSYEVELIDGYPIATGHEDSCGPFYQKFINDVGTQTTRLDNPYFILYHGKINDTASVFEFLSRMSQDPNKQNFVLVAIGFTERVLSDLALNFTMPNTINVFPLVVPMSPLHNGQMDLLQDLAALTGATIFDPLECPVNQGVEEDLGRGPTLFEASRWRSSVVGHADEILIEERVQQIEQQVLAAGSELDKTLARERIAKMTSGIAKLRVLGSSNGEVKERRDRAEDAVCAVRGAIKNGVLPGGGWTLAHLSAAALSVPGDTDEALVSREILAKALIEPVKRLYENAGYSEEEIVKISTELGSSTNTFDILNRAWVDGFDGGLLDSVPAVRDAIRNAISIASLLGTCGGTIVFGRDEMLERAEASNTAEFLRNANEPNEYM